VLVSRTTGVRNTGTGFEALNHLTPATKIRRRAFEPYLAIPVAASTPPPAFHRSLPTTGISTVPLALIRSRITPPGGGNTANSYQALYNNATVDNNTGLGRSAGSNITGSGNVCIGWGVFGEAGVNDRTYIKNVSTLAQANNLVVTIGARGLLGVQTISSRRFKNEVKPMDNASEALFSLKPVTFRYKKEFDANPNPGPQYGLVAEEVEKVSPDLVTRDENGRLLTVRYDSIHNMLLNEFLKEHKKVEALQASFAQQQKEIEALTAGLQKVSAQLELSKPAAQTVLNDQ
jgi:hypothetical protein